VRLDVLERPELRRDGLVAELLGDGDIVGLDVAVRVIRTDADPEPTGRLEQDEFDLSARLARPAFRPTRRS
jgi:hypothetical protein